ncbi:MAG TPA: ABC transporter ATP-binding protein [Vicinamibacterales bacterium]|nr:ABC transporter ATP-binding protein [Vicinamibacterales bacterium]
MPRARSSGPAPGGAARGGFARAIGYAVPYWRSLAFVAALSLVSTIVSLAIPYLSKVLVDRALLGRDPRALYVVVAWFVATSLAGFALTAITGLRYTRISANVLFDMRLALYRHLQRLSPRFYARTPLGEVLARVNNDVAEIQRVAAEALLAWTGNLLFLTGSLAAMFWLDVRLACLGVVLVPPAVWALSRLRARVADRVRTVRESSAAIGSFLVETLQAMRLVVTSNAQARELNRFGARNAAFVDALMSMQLWSYVAGAAPGLILSIGYAAVFVYGGHRVIAGTLSLGTFVAFMAYQMRLLQPVQALMGLYASLATVQVSLGRVQELLDEPPEVADPASPVPLGPLTGAIEFDRVSIDLGRGDVLSDVSFAVAPGELVAIVGPSGSGKSTIADLLVRLIDPDAGVIRIDGHDLRTVALDELRRRIVLVDQEPFVFHVSIAENIRYVRPDAGDDDVRAAAAAAGLAEFIGRQPEGDATIVGERGAALSAGERQRLAIARALLANPDVLVLDEPTAALDPDTERHIVSEYRRLMTGRTVVVITHRLAVAAAADRVLRVADGRVVEADVHAV